MKKKIFELIQPYIVQTYKNKYDLNKLNINNIHNLFSSLYSSKLPDSNQKNTLINTIEIISNTQINKSLFLKKFESI